MATARGGNVTSRTAPSTPRLLQERIQAFSPGARQGFGFGFQAAGGGGGSQKGLSHPQAHGVRHAVKNQNNPRMQVSSWWLQSSRNSCRNKFMRFAEEAACSGGVLRPYLSYLSAPT